MMGKTNIAIHLSAEPVWGNAAEWQPICESALVAAMTAAAKFTAEPAISVSIVLTCDSELRALNRDYRQKDRATNVLSFPMLGREELAALHQDDDVTAHETLLGDIALAYETCAAEAAEKGISLPQHVTHLIIHGTLHLLGYDHIEEAEGDAMEALEVKALASLGLPNPYG